MEEMLARPTRHAVRRVAMACVVTARPSGTFLKVGVRDGAALAEGAYAGVLVVAGRQAPCAVRVLTSGELWCQPRGPLPRTMVGQLVHVVVDDATAVPALAA
ncbi:MAG TPA: hypothetical protein VNT55_20370 [Baekduia sp.]|nr:hypothetical protein [Baekduia sp.]